MRGFNFFEFLNYHISSIIGKKNHNRKVPCVDLILFLKNELLTIEIWLILATYVKQHVSITKIQLSNLHIV